jgi:hypothetical protein
MYGNSRLAVVAVALPYRRYRVFPVASHHVPQGYNKHLRKICSMFSNAVFSIVIAKQLVAEAIHVVFWIASRFVPRGRNDDKEY